jgi:acyl carrier protein
MHEGVSCVGEAYFRSAGRTGRSLMSDVSEIELRQLYVQALRLHIAPQNLPNEGLLASLHIDSVSIMEIVIGIETRYGVELDLGRLSLSVFDSFENLSRHLSAECTLSPALSAK